MLSTAVLGLIIHWLMAVPPQHEQGDILVRTIICMVQQNQHDNAHHALPMNVFLKIVYCF